LFFKKEINLGKSLIPLKGALKRVPISGVLRRIPLVEANILYQKLNVNTERIVK